MTYSRSSICAPRGSTLAISASYHSYDEYYGSTAPASTSWFRTERGLQGRRRSPAMKTILQSGGRFQISTSRRTSTLRISNLEDSDSAEYQFQFQTPEFVWSSVLPGTGVTVTGTAQQQLSPLKPLIHPQQPSAPCCITLLWFAALQVQLIRASDTEIQLKCDSSCSPADRPSYVWFMDDREIRPTQTSVYEGRLHPGEKISCALEGYEDYRSPPVCKLPHREHTHTRCSRLLHTPSPVLSRCSKAPLSVSESLC